jgi:predicted amidohydrolase YtcJ
LSHLFTFGSSSSFPFAKKLETSCRKKEDSAHFIAHTALVKESLITRICPVYLQISSPMFPIACSRITKAHHEQNMDSSSTPVKNMLRGIFVKKKKSSELALEYRF